MRKSRALTTSSMKSTRSVPLESLLETTPQSLAKLQHDELKKHAIAVLLRVADLIGDEKYDEVDSHTFYSPSGDGYGMDNNCIDFKVGEDHKDILDIVEKLRTLKALSEIKENDTKPIQNRQKP